MKIVLLLLLGLLALPVAASPLAVQSFTPQAGFGGASEGHGRLKLLFGKERPYRVENFGQRLANGSFRLDQTVVFEGKPAEQRHWILTTVKPGAYTGTLTDAAGKVAGRTQGAQLTLRYRLKGPLFMHQTLDLMPDGRINNVGKITLLGIPVGHLQETIVRRPAAG